MAPSHTVIKVKFGDTLRRFNAHIHKEELDFDMIMLREKICSFFGFSHDVDFTLTYIDEDGDVVTLCDDADLHDVAAQSLDPLRITVTLSTEKAGGSSTPLKPTQDQLLFEFLNSVIFKMLNFVSEPLNNMIPKLDFASEATGASSITDSGATPENMTGASDVKDQQGSKIDGASEMLPVSNSEVLTMKGQKILEDGEVGSPDSKNETVQLEMLGEVFQHPANTKDDDLESIYDYTARFVLEGDSYQKNDSVFVKNKKDIENISAESAGGVEQKDVSFGASNPDYLKLCLQDTLAKTSSTNNSSSSMSNAINECPVEEIPCPYTIRVLPFKRGYKPGNGLAGLSREVVLCDRCRIFPLTWPRLNSKVKPDHCPCNICIEELDFDYGLCNTCVGEIGFDVDRLKLDHPLICRKSLPLNRFHDHDSGKTSSNLNLSRLINDTKDPEIVNSEMDNVIGLVEPEDLFFDALQLQHKEQEMNLDQEPDRLKRLKHMGLHDVHLNKATSSKFIYDLEKTVTEFYQTLNQNHKDC